MVNPDNDSVSVPADPVASVQLPPVGRVVVPQVERQPTTGSNPESPTTVTVAVVFIAWNLNHIVLSADEPAVQSPVAFSSEQDAVLKDVVTHDALGVNV